MRLEDEGKQFVVVDKVTASRHRNKQPLVLLLNLITNLRTSISQTQRIANKNSRTRVKKQRHGRIM